MNTAGGPSLPVERAGLVTVQLASSPGGIVRGALSRMIA